MSEHFTGTLTGRSSVASVQQGTKHSGLDACLWSKSGRVHLRMSNKNGKDHVQITIVRENLPDLTIWDDMLVTLDKK